MIWALLAVGLVHDHYEFLKTPIGCQLEAPRVKALDRSGRVIHLACLMQSVVSGELEPLAIVPEQLPDNVYPSAIALPGKGRGEPWAS